MQKCFFLSYCFGACLKVSQIYWIGQKVHLDFSIKCCRKSWTNFLAIPIPLHVSWTNSYNRIWRVFRSYIHLWLTSHPISEYLFWHEKDVLISWCLWLFSSVQSVSCVQLFATPWTAARQASLSFANSWSLPKLMSIESVMPSNHLISVVPFSSCLQSFPASGSFPRNQFFASGGQSIGVSASTSVLPMKTQDWSPLGWTGWISLQSKGP